MKKHKTAAQLEHARYCRTPHFLLVRQFVLFRDNTRCVLCNRKAVQVHHRSYKHMNDFPEEVKDCVSLCRRCHLMFHSNAKVKQEKVEMDDLTFDAKNGGYWKK